MTSNWLRFINGPSGWFGSNARSMSKANQRIEELMKIEMTNPVDIIRECADGWAAESFDYDVKDDEDDQAPAGSWLPR